MAILFKILFLMHMASGRHVLSPFRTRAYNNPWGSPRSTGSVNRPLASYIELTRYRPRSVYMDRIYDYQRPPQVASPQVRLPFRPGANIYQNIESGRRFIDHRPSNPVQRQLPEMTNGVNMQTYTSTLQPLFTHRHEYPRHAPPTTHITPHITNLNEHIRTQHIGSQSLRNGNILNPNIETAESSTTSSRNISTEANSLLALLNRRQSPTGNLIDEIAMRHHIMHLNDLNTGGTNKEGVIEKQLSYVANITEVAIRREVLKLLVKDIVEKSGLMTREHQGPDLASLISLVEMIDNITNTFANSETLSDSTRKLTNILTNITRNNSTLVQPVTVTHIDAVNPEGVHPGSAQSRTALRRRIVQALSTFSQSSAQRDKQIERLSAVLNNKSRVALDTSRRFNSSRLKSYSPSRSATASKKDFRPSVGMSIYGDKIVQPFVTTTLGTTTIDFSKREPAGGNSAYWTHLSSGLVDILCRLCQQRQNETCIQRYCNNSVG